MDIKTIKENKLNWRHKSREKIRAVSKQIALPVIAAVRIKESHPFSG